MTTMSRLVLCAITVTLMVFALPAQAFFQSLGFTYQGLLKSGGVPANGTHHLRFQLWSGAVIGVQIGGTIDLPSVNVVDGLFTVSLDFGSNAFSGSDRWLQIQVVTDGGSTVTTLSPRQLVTNTPYALYARSAALPATYAAAVNFSNPGNAYAGSGSGLTNLNAAALNGTIGSVNIGGTYSNALTLDNAANAITGVFTGSGAALTSLNASNLTSGNLSNARLPTSGPWGLTGNLNIDTGTLFIDPTTNRVGVNTNSPTSTLGVRGTLAVESTLGLFAPAFELLGGDGEAEYSVFSMRHSATERVRFDTSSLGGVEAEFNQVNGSTGVRVIGSGKVELIDSGNLTLKLEARQESSEGANILMKGTISSSEIRLRAEETAAGNNGSVIELDAEDGTETIELDSGTAAGFAVVTIDGNLTANSKSAIVTIDGEKKLFFCTEAPEMLFEDHGSGQLVNGRAEIALDREFLQTVIVNEQYPMRVMITLTDDCKGVFVKKFGDRFVVQELMGGTSNATFDYKVICNRAGYQHLRLPPYRKQGLFETQDESAEAGAAPGLGGTARVN